jgi:hypothetical protein
MRFRPELIAGMMLMLALLGLAANPAAAQPPCGYARSFSYPVDTNTFHLVQDYGVASPRHQGRFHTGEDWSAGYRGSALGQPVRAAAAGRVTYSYWFGWGTDGGVVIIEHTLPDDTIIYTQYGHIGENDDVSLPGRLSCVEAGQIIGVIVDSRPAPHLHFEMRVNQPDIPGPGYTREPPTELGWRRPAQMMANLQARLHPAYRWHVTINTYRAQLPPLVLSDHSLLVVSETDVLRRVTPDGRILWRVILDRPAASISGFQANPLLTYTDGRMTRVDYDGSRGDTWQLEFSPQGPPLRVGDASVYHTAGDALVALAPDRRELLWRLEGVPAFSRAHVSGSLIALVIDDELLLISHNGELLNRVELRSGASLATAPDGTLLVYTYGGLWRVNVAGEWSETLPGVEIPNGGGPAAVTVTGDGRIYLTDGEQLHAFSRIGQSAWQARLPQSVTGLASLHHYDNILLLTSSGGDIIAARDTGGICGFTRLYGDDLSGYWHHLGDDGVLRVAVNDQLLGLDWRRFAGGC